MKILIACREDYGKNYVDAVKSIGCELDCTIYPKDLSIYDGLLLPGGVDIHPKYYGQNIAGSVDIDDELDHQQFKILDYFVKQKKPVFGICRGHQLINIYFGGTLIQHIEQVIHHKVVVDSHHDAICVNNSYLKDVYGEQFKINSAHHQAVNKVGNQLEVTLMSEDGIIEGLRHKLLPIISVQWHPERTGFSFLSDEAVDGEKIFHYFINEVH